MIARQALNAHPPEQRAWVLHLARYPSVLAMPKMKSHSGASKRFKKTGTGKLKSRPAFSSHILEKKSPKKKRALGLEKTVAKSDARTVRKLLEGSGK